jgi:hypothetical protein
MESLPRLPDQYLERAKEMILEHRRRKSCKTCFDRGYLGVNQDNMLVPCNKCVDHEALMQEWKGYVAATPELEEMYGEYYASEESEVEPESAEKEVE